MSTVLVVDDEKNYQIVLEDLLEDEGYDVCTASSGAEALDIIAGRQVDTVISDIKMPGMTGVELLERISGMDPDLPVILMTAYAEVDQAVEAMKMGALDHIQKPYENKDVKRAVQRGVEKRALVQNLRRLENELGAMWGDIIGKSKAIEKVLSLMKRVAPANTTVLITGESGTGKELIARGLHKASKRSKAQFVSINCAAIPDSLLESELFGHERGAFTGASTTKQGKFEVASSGTLFLDEIGEMDISLQVKLLRAVQEQEIQRVGGNSDISVDVRIIAATNKNLEEEVKKGNFREDLYFRLNVVNIDVPPLRRRKEDIPLLVAHFAQKFAHKLDKGLKMVEPEVMEALQRYSWPGNVRELENIMERATVLSRGHSIELGDLPSNIRDASDNGLGFENILYSGKGLSETLETIEEKLIKQALNDTSNVQNQAAKILGISRSNLQYKMKKYGLL